MGHGEQSYDGMHFQILELCVANDMKGHGIGGRMLNEFLDYLDRKGVTSVYLLFCRLISTGATRKNSLWRASMCVCPSPP